MTVYKKNFDKNTMIELTFPSTGGEGWIKVPSRLGLAVRKKINSDAMTAKVVMPNAEQILEAEKLGIELRPNTELFFDPNTAAYELLVQSMTHRAAYHNLTDEDGKPIVITRGWIDSEMDEDDGLFMGQVLLTGMWDQVGAAPPEGEPKEGDSPLATPETSAETSATAGPPPKTSKTK